MSDFLRIACLQYTSSNNLEYNLEQLDGRLQQAAEKGARAVVLPENFAWMGASTDETLAECERHGFKAVAPWLQAKAQQYDILLMGTNIMLDENDCPKNRCMAFAPTGSLLAVYDKIHLFQASLDDREYNEGKLFQAGQKPCFFDWASWRIGLSICYDLRFPELYRYYQTMACDLVIVPSAFAKQTGKVHWQVLLQARAIENQCFIAAANQYGQHADGRQTWGHSCIINAWGETMSELAISAGMVIATLSRQHMQQVRTAMPALEHRRM